ncbi:MAG: hypothetical protein F4Y63_00500 [Chloroflexi bacterium]|nr:hypothetical protein [Chloroflexota bacterium]MYK60800.1 hypothetical protein [Chloroflexota bacterium]
MKKRLTVILSVTAVSLLAAVGIFAGIAAQSTDDDSGRQSFAERVASILGLETSDVEDAFAQAKEEIRDERSDGYLAKLVEHAKLTQEEADAIQTWLDAKPDIELTMAGKRGLGGKGFGGHHGSLVLADDKLDYLVEKGVLTQSDADSLSDWYDAQPDAIIKLMPNPSGWKNGGHRGWRGKMGRWGSGKDWEKDTSHTDMSDDA